MDPRIIQQALSKVGQVAQGFTQSFNKPIQQKVQPINYQKAVQSFNQPIQQRYQPINLPQVSQQVGRTLQQTPNVPVNRLPVPNIWGIPNLPMLPKVAGIDTNPAQFAANIVAEVPRSYGRTLERAGQRKFAQGGFWNTVEDVGNVLPLATPVAKVGGKFLTRVGSGLVDVGKNFNDPAVQAALKGARGGFRVENPAVKRIPINQLISHEKASDLQAIEKYKQAFRIDGPVQPIYAFREGAKFGVEDGKHRLEALRQLGYKDAPVIELKRTPYNQIVSAIKNQEGKIQLGPKPKLPTQTTGGVKLKREAPLAKQLTKPIPESPQPMQTGGTQQLGLQIKPGSTVEPNSSGTSGKIISRVANPTDPYFNINRLNVSNRAQKRVFKAVEQIKPQIEKVVGTKLSNKEAINLANNSAKMLHTVVSREETLAWEAKMLKARQMLAQQAKDGTVTQDYLDNLLAIKSQGSDIARKLQSLGINADPQTITAKHAILEAILKVNQNTDEILAAAKGVDFNDMRQATEFYRRFIAPKASEWIDLIRYNSMLSSPNTHINNFSSNLQGSLLVAPIEKTILGGIDFLRATATGTPRRYAVGEGASYLKGALSNLRPAAHKFADVMTGKAMNLNSDTRTLPLATKGPKHVAEVSLAIPTRLLEAADQFFTTLVQAGSERSLNYRASRGIKVRDPQAKAHKEAAKRLFRGDFNEEGQGYILDMLDSGANALMMLRNSENPVLSTIAKFSFPFVKTPTNILKQGVEYSPLGLTTLPGNTAKAEQLTKAIMGTSIGLGVATLLGSDRLTWAEPTSPTLKNKFRDAGLQPYSIKIGNNWISYSKMHPVIAFNLAFVAAIRDAEQNKRLGDEEIETALAGLSKWVNFFADQSYVKNIGDFLASTKGDIEGPARYISNYPQQLIPYRALMGWVARLTDPYQRQVDKDGSALEKQLQQLMTQIPGLSQNVPARLNAFGQPIENQNRVLNAFSPARVTTENPQAKQLYDNSVLKSKEIKMVNDLKKQLKEEAGGLSSKDFPAGSIVSGDTSLSAPSISEDSLNPQRTSFRIDGADTPGFTVGNRFVYIDELTGEEKSASIPALKRKELADEKELFDAQYANSADVLKRAEDFQGYTQNLENYIKYLEYFKEQTGDTTQKIRVETAINDKKAELAKLKGYNGLKKPKKLKITSRKAPSFKVKKSKKLKTKKVKIKAIKLDSPRGSQNAQKIKLNV